MLNGDIEDAKHQVALVLLDPAFATLISAIDAEKGAVTATPPPAAVFKGAMAQTKIGQGSPVCEVIGHKTDYDVADQHAKTATHEIGVYWTHWGDDELTITTQLERLVRATRDALWNGLLTAIASAPVEVVGEEYSPLMPGKNGAFVKSSATTIRVRTVAL